MWSVIIGVLYCLGYFYSNWFFCSQEARLKSANHDLHRAQITLVQKEEELSNVKKLYCAAVKEKQKLTNEAEICRRKMSAASTLINGLSGEKMRWTQQSKAFKEQMIRLVGDVLLSTGFLSYAGPFNQEFRQSLIQNWKGLLKNRNIPYTNALNVVEMLVDTIETSEWALQVSPIFLCQGKLYFNLDLLFVGSPER